MCAQRVQRDLLRRTVIGHQLFVSGFVFTRDHNHFANAWVRADHGFNFAQLNTKAADLDLVIDAAQVFKVAIRQAARQVAGTIEVS